MSQLALAPEEITATFREALGDAVVETSTAFGQATVVVGADRWIDALAFARDDTSISCDFFSWLSGIEWVSEEEPQDAAGADADEAASGEAGAGAEDEPEAAPEAEAQEDSGGSGDESEYRAPAGDLFQVVARLSSTRHHHSVTLKANLDHAAPRVATATVVYEGADWHERELAEMYGVEVVGHPNLVKLYLPDHFEGHPLRKSYKLGAREVKPWPGDVNVEDMPEDTPVTEPEAGQP